ncbi:GNAT family N-acetyltransferase [Streptomyces sp. NPDC092359]|uniref:GNAT family N-acetyltransferase n=1 Tax=Streptomyces sp. NPDC092359 TaxID=3366014 RepID=UPI0037FC48FF
MTARHSGRLVGHVIGDGGAHAFLLDTTAHPGARRTGLGTALVRAAAEAPGGAARTGSTWTSSRTSPASTSGAASVPPPPDSST